MLETETKMIVEAVKDKVWGIGCAEFTSPNVGLLGAKNEETGGWDIKPKDWMGENLLGRCLMDVRKLLAIDS